MTTRTVLLTLHIALAAGWIGADFVVHVLTPRMQRSSDAVQLAWARQIHWMHDRYYAVVAALLAVTGVLLVLDGDWSWSSGFIWVGIVAILGGASLGGGGLKSQATKEIGGLESGDAAAVRAARRTMLPLSIVVTLLPIVAILAMVDKWEAERLMVDAPGERDSREWLLGPRGAELEPWAEAVANLPGAERCRAALLCVPQSAPTVWVHDDAIDDLAVWDVLQALVRQHDAGDRDAGTWTEVLGGQAHVALVA